MRQDKSKLLQFFRQPSVRTHCMEQLGIRKHEYSRKYLDFIDRLASSQSPIEKSASISTRTDGNGRSTWDSHQNFSEGRIISMFQQYLENQSQASLSASSLQGGPKTHKKVRELADLRNPVNWYQFARGNRRKIFLHVGPTNRYFLDYKIYGKVFLSNVGVVGKRIRHWKSFVRLHREFIAVRCGCWPMKFTRE